MSPLCGGRTQGLFSLDVYVLDKVKRLEPGTSMDRTQSCRSLSDQYLCAMTSVVICVCKTRVNSNPTHHQKVQSSPMSISNDKQRTSVRHVRKRSVWVPKLSDMYPRATYSGVSMPSAYPIRQGGSSIHPMLGRCVHNDGCHA